jgi:very-short-patch-repair endonuclease
MPNEKARKLRLSSSDAERRMWSALRGRRLAQYMSRRQHPVGPYIVDFACTRHQLVIELDGGQYADNSADARRTEWLESEGWKVIRFWNNEALSNTNGVIEAILRALQTR